MSTQRIALWSGPRNVSTALMYSFAQRSDMRVLDEPLFGWFLQHTGVDRPSRVEALAAMETDAAVVFREQLLGPCDRPALFMKHMANHMVGLDYAQLEGFQNVILTRQPADVITSYIKNVETPTLLDLAYQQQAEILNYLQSRQLPVVVVDSRQVLQGPEATLKALCKALDSPWESAMLQWEPGARPEDGVWAKYWYHNVHKSSGFAPWKPKNEPVPSRLQPLLQACQPYYEQLRSALLITPDTDE